MCLRTLCLLHFGIPLECISRMPPTEIIKITQWKKLFDDFILRSCMLSTWELESLGAAPAEARYPSRWGI